MSVYEMWTVVVLGVTAFIFLLQAAIAVQSLTADHTRRRKEATINHMNDIRPQYFEIDQELISKLGKGALDDAKIDAILQDSELLNRIKMMLGLFEHLAVGANEGVFDIGLLDRMSGRHLIDVHDRFGQYIERRRSEDDNPRYYEEFDKLVKKIKSRRRRAIS